MPVQDINDMRVWATCFSASCALWSFLCQIPKIPLPQQNVFFLSPAFLMAWRIWQFSVWWAVLATWLLAELSSVALSLLESSSAPTVAFQMVCISSLQLARPCFRALGAYTAILLLELAKPHTASFPPTDILVSWGLPGHMAAEVSFTFGLTQSC